MRKYSSEPAVSSIPSFAALLVISFLMSPAPLRAQSSPWVKIGEVGGDESTSFVDTSNVIRVESGFVLVKVALWFPRNHTPPNFAAGTRYTVTPYEFDCQARRFRIGPGASYSEQQKVLAKDPDPNYSAWIDPQPATTGEGLVSGVCEILRTMKPAD